MPLDIGKSYSIKVTGIVPFPKLLEDTMLKFFLQKW